MNELKLILIQLDILNVQLNFQFKPTLIIKNSRRKGLDDQMTTIHLKCINEILNNEILKNKVSPEASSCLNQCYHFPKLNI